MRRPLLVLAAMLASAAGATWTSTAQAATSSIPFSTCADQPTFGCAHVTVPVDPSGAIPGTINLAVRRKLAATGTATEAVVALAGGPGQAALPFAPYAAQLMSSALANRDLVVFDQRGTGDSGPLQCSAFSQLNTPVSLVVPNCAQQIGPTRGLYTTDDSVADIEALRKALGYTKLVLYGTSYGTKVALRYAAEYPQNVSALVLDSTVVPNGPDVFDQSTYQAVPRILGQLCASGACPGIPDPVGDLRRVLARTVTTPVRAALFSGTGKRTTMAISAGAIAGLLISGDVDPVLRADFPAAIHAAAHGQWGLLALLVNHAQLGGAVESQGIDNPLFFDTECEELPFPWDRAATPTDRLTAALAAAAAMPAGTFGPFSYRTAVAESVAPVCSYWPFASAAPETAITALPDVPTLIISGANDLRTPTANADAVASMIPDAKVVVVPQTGHSVLTTEPGTCAQTAVNDFFTGLAVPTTCAPRALPGYLQPARAVPASVRALVPLGGTHGTAGRTAHAVAVTLEWSAREFADSLYETLIGSYNPALNHGLGGLHGGYATSHTSATTRKDTVSFHRFSYVRGVTVTGSFTSGTGRLVIRGRGAAHGTLVARTPNSFSGTLGGVRVHFHITGAATTALRATVRGR